MGAHTWYYALWADGLTAVEQNSKSHLSLRARRILLLMTFSIAQGLNLSTLFIVSRPWIKTCLITTDLGLGDFLNNLIMGLGVYIAPFVALNYLLVFHKDKNKSLISPPPHSRKPGWLFMGYFLLSSMLFLGPLVLGKALP